MFGALTEKFQALFSTLAKTKTFTEENLAEATRHVRLALLDADVNFTVASRLVKKIKDQVIGQAILNKVSAKDQFIKVVHDELAALMGEGETGLKLEGKPATIMLCGLQGSGKTTQAAKLALLLKQKPYDHKKILLAACDLQRPAAIEQLQLLASQVEVDAYVDFESQNSIEVARHALAKAKSEQYDLVIFDTAGRLHVDEALMKQLQEIKQLVKPHETLFVASAATGQDAVKTAQAFDEMIGIDGSILTMLDGHARAGAAISIREMTQKPLKFEGVGERMGDLRIFNPCSMADRILGMGDVINLVKKAEQHFDEKEAEKLEKKIRKATFTYQDFLKQMKMIRKMGSFSSLFKMLPGASQLGDLSASEGEFKKIEAVILSMTSEEREGRVDLEMSRRRRIAKGSGTSVDDVNRLVKNFKRLRQMIKKLPSMSKKLTKNPSFRDLLTGQG